MASDLFGSRVRLAIKIAKGTKTGVGRVPNDYVIEDFNFQELPGSNEVTSDFDVGFRWARFTARMIMRDNDCGGTRHDG